jgi:hypothetical protein
VTDSVPRFGEALLVAVGVLNHLPLEPLRVAGDDAVADRAAVVLHVDAHRAGEADPLEQTLDDLGEMVEGVVPVGRIRHVAVAEPGVVG